MVNFVRRMSTYRCTTDEETVNTGKVSIGVSLRYLDKKGGVFFDDVITLSVSQLIITCTCKNVDRVFS